MPKRITVADLVGIVGRLNVEMDNRDDLSMSAGLYLRTDGYRHDVKWMGDSLWDNEDNRPEEETVETTEIHIRESIAALADYTANFKNMDSQGKGCFHPGIMCSACKDQANWPNCAKAKQDQESYTAITPGSAHRQPQEKAGS